MTNISKPQTIREVNFGANIVRCVRYQKLRPEEVNCCMHHEPLEQDFDLSLLKVKPTQRFVFPNMETECRVEVALFFGEAASIRC